MTARAARRHGGLHRARIEGTVYVGGTSLGAATGRDYVVLQVHVPSGRIIWTRRYDGPGTRDELRGLHADVDGNVYVTGESADGGGSTAAATLLYDIGGRRLWVRRLHTARTARRASL